jgi:hypothetical protein
VDAGAERAAASHGPTLVVGGDRGARRALGRALWESGRWTLSLPLGDVASRLVGAVGLAGVVVELSQPRGPALAWVRRLRVEGGRGGEHATG